MKIRKLIIEQIKIRVSASSRESSLIVYEAIRRANELEPKKIKNKMIEREKSILNIEIWKDKYRGFALSTFTYYLKKISLNLFCR